ncbi:MAG: hypothetical protein ACRELX_13355 [Longimicrobiales bacterium]
MENTVESRVVEVLRREPTYTLPVRALHGALVAELGRGPGTYGELAAALGRRPDLFVVMEPTDPLGAAPGWSPTLRSEYYAELRSAGFDPEPRVALVAPEPLAARPDPGARAGTRALANLESSLVALWAAETGASPLRATLAAALTEMEEIRRMLAQDE